MLQLLVVVGGESSGAAVVHGDGAADRLAALASGVASPAGRSGFQ